MPKSEFGGCSRWSKAVQCRVARALRPFRGSASGAAMVEYLVVVGFCAFIAILGFYRFGRNVHSHLKVEAQHIEGKGMPGGEGMGDALELLDALGAMPDPFEPQDLIESLMSGSGVDLPSGMGLDSVMPGSGTSTGSSGSGLPGGSEASTGFPSPLPGGPTGTESSSTPSESTDTGSASPAPPSPAPPSAPPTDTGSASPAPPSPAPPSAPPTGTDDSLYGGK